MRLSLVFTGGALFATPALSAAAFFVRTFNGDYAGNLWLIDTAISEEPAWKNVSPTKHCSTTGTYGGAGCSVGGYAGTFIGFSTIGCNQNLDIYNGMQFYLSIRAPLGVKLYN
ncbi:uncharacterized protein N7459_005351 [Penicillium hispanicum]|uniref:uncharacterized protein n=1 Tax=Penicillium hispanicum TaxID=1080232 RepID=UPI002540741B|nr:uncharacterized protein N7459_005351 [Penicillium hispanicum]KAJ5585551.1 hypothetical protein N7459_005351 [Penicillium hispanicum]